MFCSPLLPFLWARTTGAGLLACNPELQRVLGLREGFTVYIEPHSENVSDAIF